MRAKSQVNRYAAADPEAAVKHFENRFRYETDCWDVHHAIENGVVDFVLLDVRSSDLYENGHIPSAIHLPHSRISPDTLPNLSENAIYVVYCAGPHCNGANKAALKIAKLGLPVKEMIGGVEGWKDEGFDLAKPGSH